MKHYCGLISLVLVAQLFAPLEIHAQKLTAQNYFSELSTFFDQIQKNYGGYNAQPIDLTQSEMSVYYKPAQTNNFWAIYFTPIKPNWFTMRVFGGSRNPNKDASALNAIETYFSSDKQLALRKKASDPQVGQLIALYRNPEAAKESGADLQLETVEVRLKP